MLHAPSRRALLGAVATASIAGCIDAFSDQEGCDLEHGRWRGDAASITTTVEVGEDETTEQQAARAAAEAAFARLDEKLDMKLEGKQWISPGFSHTDQYDAFVRVREVRNRDGTVRLCPDSAFDVEEARVELPERVTVTVHSGGAEAGDTHNHEIELVSAREELD